MAHWTRLIAGGLAIALSAPSASHAHPHMFIDTGVDFLFDGDGRLAHLRITWLYDHFSTLLLLEDLDVAPGPDGTLDPEAAALVAFDQSQWIEGYDGDATLRHAGRRVGLSRPIEPQADYRDGQVEVRFLRALDEPIRPGDDTLVMAYDPTYYVAYILSFESTLEHAPPGCEVRVEEVEPTGPLAALQRSLFELPPDEDPDEPVGHLFADRIYVSCP
jgi:ABC-type uncharacterized transport system substrate-binding protein